jgi:hypothetical protein
MSANLRKHLLPGIILILMGQVVTPCKSQQQKSNVFWPEIRSETKPWSRWWWMGSAVDGPNLSRLMAEYGQAGFGGLEITPIYGAVGFEGKYLPFLSQEWMKMLDLSVLEARKNGMGIDMNTGTGWPFGGPQIGRREAASRLIVQKYSLESGQKLADRIVPSDQKQKDEGATLQALTAYGSAGEVMDLIPMTDLEGNLNWVAEKGSWEIYAAFCGKTFQKVKRAAPGGEGLTLDHFSKEALRAYLARFDSAFQQSNHGVRNFFNDSYEVYGTNWTSSVFDEFLKRRGYKLQPYLRELSEKKPSTDISRRVQCDYRETISDLLLDNFTRAWTGWAHDQGSMTRNQAHGSPGNLLDLYAAVDIPECETFGNSQFFIPGLRRDSSDIRKVDPDPVMLKFASSAANVAGKKLTSSETFTWLAEHFRVSLSQCKPEVEQAFLSGVNHVFYHGTAYSPTEAGWPGWLFYASVNFSPSNSFWPHIRGLNEYITRCQSVLQDGVPSNDLLVYWPVYDIWMTSEISDIMLTIHSIDKWLYPSPFCKDVKELMQQGYSLDFVSDNLLGNISVRDGLINTKAGSSYRTLIVPSSKFMPVKTLIRLKELASMGAKVIFQQMPADVPGFNSLETLRQQKEDLVKSIHFADITCKVKAAKTGKGEILLADQLQSALELKGIFPEKLVDSGLKYLRRIGDTGVYYYLVNHTATTVDDFLPFNQGGINCVMLDPQTGETGVAQTRMDREILKVRVQMRPGEAMFVMVSPNIVKGKKWNYTEQALTPVEVKGPWKLEFTVCGSLLPKTTELQQLVSWTELTDATAGNFSGSARYSTTVDLQGDLAGEYLLDLGKVCESAKVKVNGRDAGILWSIPFTAKIGKLLKPGKNTIEIEVCNLMANRIRQMDQEKIQWRNYHEINFVNIDYKPFDASKWKPMPSGLLGPVRIIPVQLN